MKAWSSAERGCAGRVSFRDKAVISARAIMHIDREFAFYALGRAGYGASLSSPQELLSSGFPAWVEEQLAPRGGDPAAEERIRAARLRIKYAAGDGWPATTVWPTRPRSIGRHRDGWRAPCKAQPPLAKGSEAYRRQWPRSIRDCLAMPMEST